jgi:hypothetical protein
MSDAIQNNKEWDIILEGSSYALYSLYDVDALISHASKWSNILCILGRMQKINIHYLGWPGDEQMRLRNSINGTATILFYDCNESNAEKEYNKWITNFDSKPYMVGCDEDSVDSIMKKSINKISGKPEFEISVNILFATDVFLTIFEDIGNRTYSPLTEILPVTNTKNRKNSKCSIM